MNKDEAWRIIEECRNWNVSQRSISGDPAEERVLDARRAALAEAWRTVGDDYPRGPINGG